MMKKDTSAHSKKDPEITETIGMTKKANVETVRSFTVKRILGIFQENTTCG